MSNPSKSQLLLAAVAIALVPLSLFVWQIVKYDGVPGEPPDLIFHARFCDVPDLQRLMEEGEDPNKLIDGRSTVWRVVAGADAESGCIDSLRVLVSAGGSIDRTERGFTALGMAATSDVEAGMIEYLYELGADPCLPLEQQVDLEASLDYGPEPKSLVEVAERLSSLPGASELTRISENCGLE